MCMCARTCVCASQLHTVDICLVQDLHICMHVCVCVCERERLGLCLCLHSLRSTSQLHTVDICLIQALHICMHVCVRAYVCVCVPASHCRFMLDSSLEHVCMRVCVCVCAYVCVRPNFTLIHCVYACVCLICVLDADPAHMHACVCYMYVCVCIMN